MVDPFDVLQRVWQNLAARPSGSLSFRFLIQPLVAAAFAIRDGIKDARATRSPYLWTIMTNKEERGARLNEGFAATTKILVVALVLDVIYQFIELRTFYPGEAVIVALLLAFVPYVLIRGPAARIARWRMGPALDETREAKQDLRKQARRWPSHRQ